MTYLVSGPARNFCWGDTQSDEIPTTTAKLMALDVPGGLVVQLGASDVRLATELAHSGRFLVHVLERDPVLVERMRKQLQDERMYGLISLEQVPAFHALPYTENLVNLVVVQDTTADDTLAEVQRVLCPRGIVLGVREALSADTLAAVGLRHEDVTSLGDQWLGRAQALAGDHGRMDASASFGCWERGVARYARRPATPCPLAGGTLG